MNSSTYAATYHTIRGKYYHHTWNQATTVPLLLTDGTNDYLYRPGGTPIEQIDSTGTITYLHTDQAGTVRLLTNTTGTLSPLGYDSQYTDPAGLAGCGIFHPSDCIHDVAHAASTAAHGVAEGLGNAAKATTPGISSAASVTISKIDSAGRYIAQHPGQFAAIAGGTLLLVGGTVLTGGLADVLIATAADLVAEDAGLEAADLAPLI